jgi:hypothetical protein
MHRLADDAPGLGQRGPVAVVALTLRVPTISSALVAAGLANTAGSCSCRRVWGRSNR